MRQCIEDGTDLYWRCTVEGQEATHVIWNSNLIQGKNCSLWQYSNTGTVALGGSEIYIPEDVKNSNGCGSKRPGIVSLWPAGQIRWSPGSLPIYVSLWFSYSKETKEAEFHFYFTLFISDKEYWRGRGRRTMNTERGMSNSYLLNILFKHLSGIWYVHISDR